ncbi:MAG: efflux RND transporter periplasmic adaptor subunit [Bryobacterales bacterium]|nr:efflux RND transporter periplasmic adaptor subunit [Bryobacterales bacterium]
MKRNCISILIVGFALVSCRQQTQTKSAAPSNGDKEEPRAEAVTHWTAKTEIFLEYPTLVAGTKSRFAVHVTSLESFKPQKSGKVEVILKAGEGTAEVFSATAPSRPGIFGVDVQPGKPGTYEMSVVLSAPDVSDRHDLGVVKVYPDAKSVEHRDNEAREETLPFLKEQQWALDFSTELVRERQARETIRVPAEISPRAGGEAVVAVPFQGRLASSTLPPIGTMVEKGQVLATIVPSAGNASELPAMELAKAEAEAALQLAGKERQRAERLLSAGAGPARKVDEARFAEQTAEARLTAADARLRQYQASREAAPDQPATKPFLLRAPIGGLVIESHAPSGSNVEAGTALVKIVDADIVYVSAIVPEGELPRIARFREAELEVPGREITQKLNRLVSVGRLVDPDTRTFRVIYESANHGRSLAINQTVFARLLGTAGKPQASVPVSAVVDDGGRPVVFVQLGGEAFARRPVTLGVTEGSYVQVAEGVKPGERVVSRGAYLVRLSALSSQIPAHGHVH